MKRPTTKTYPVLSLTIAATFANFAASAPADSPTTIDAASLQSIYTFSGSDGRWPVSGLVQDAGARLYGATRFGGPSDGSGVIFSILPSGSDFRLLHTFTNETRPNGLMLSTNGRLYGTLDVGLAAFEMNTDGTGYRMLRSVPFANESRGLIGPLVEGTAGILLGAVEGYGGNPGGGIGRMNKDGTGFTETYHLQQHFPYAVYVQPPLALGQDGRFFGVSGTANQQFGDSAASLGSLFSVQPDGTGFQTLLDLGALGWVPTSHVLSGSDGKFYGTARASNSTSSAIWRANADGGGFTIVKLFRCEDGSLAGPLVEGANGRLYGTSTLGSVYPCTAPYEFLVTGLFSISRDGSNYAREWEEVFRDRQPSILTGLSLFLQGRDGALYGSGQFPPGNLVRYQPGNIPGSPILIQCQPDTIAPEGSRVVFAPAVRGAAPLAYQWTHNGTVITGATNAWLGIDSVQASDFGTYAIAISNELGGTKCSFAFSAPQPLKLSPPHPLPHDMELHVRGSDNLPFVIEASSDLQTWRMVSGGELTDGRATVSISAAIVRDQRYFRGRYVPIGLPDE